MYTFWEGVKNGLEFSTPNGGRGWKIVIIKNSSDI